MNTREQLLRNPECFATWLAGQCAGHRDVGDPMLQFGEMATPELVAWLLDPNFSQAYAAVNELRRRYLVARLGKPAGRIDWPGGAQPVPDGTKVRFWLRDGNFADESAEDLAWYWGSHENMPVPDENPVDIIAYEVIEEPAP